MWMLRDEAFDRRLRFTAITTDDTKARTRPLRVDDQPQLEVVDLGE